jgi:hypothetical protein
MKATAARAAEFRCQARTSHVPGTCLAVAAPDERGRLGGGGRVAAPLKTGADGAKVPIEAPTQWAPGSARKEIVGEASAGPLFAALRLCAKPLVSGSVAA